jgi:hypothetical protein
MSQRIGGAPQTNFCRLFKMVSLCPQPRKLRFCSGCKYCNNRPIFLTIPQICRGAATEHYFFCKFLLPSPNLGRNYSHDFGMQNKERAKMCFDNSAKPYIAHILAQKENYEKK